MDCNVNLGNLFQKLHMLGYKRNNIFIGLNSHKTSGHWTRSCHREKTDAMFGRKSLHSSLEVLAATCLVQCADTVPLRNPSSATFVGNSVFHKDNRQSFVVSRR